MKLQSDAEVVADVLLAVVRGDVVHLSIEVEGQHIPQAGIHRQVCEWKVRCRLSKSRVVVTW